ncbi:hypothetical protein MTO96_018410 [Rhipicephalus appendiculatus]
MICDSQSRDSVTSDRLRQDWSRLRAATATDARNFERIALMDRKFEDRKAAGGPKKAQPPFPVLTIPEDSRNSARETGTVSGVSLAPYWIPDEIKHYFRHRHSEEDDSSRKTDVALREIGLERELPAINGKNCSRWAATWCRNPRHALVALMAVLTGTLLACASSCSRSRFSHYVAGVTITRWWRRRTGRRLGCRPG